MFQPQYGKQRTGLDAMNNVTQMRTVPDWIQLQYSDVSAAKVFMVMGSENVMVSNFAPHI